jgi:hypothetical protein
MPGWSANHLTTVGALARRFGLLPSYPPTRRHRCRAVGSSPSLVLQPSYPGNGPDDAAGMVGVFTAMTRLSIVIIVGVLAAAPRASAACRWFGTQLECHVGASRLVMGTQAAKEPV